MFKIFDFREFRSYNLEDGWRIREVEESKIGERQLTFMFYGI